MGVMARDASFILRSGIHATKSNENNMLTNRFSVAPMMDWVDSL
jgi:hypothetical protein